jgi:DNA-binding transcriptional regulator YdaS (Cro superfamily)
MSLAGTETQLAQSPLPPIDRALTEHGLGNREVATALGISTEAVRRWRVGSNGLRAEPAMEIHRKFGIPLHQLRPDLWPPDRTPPRRKRPA